MTMQPRKFKIPWGQVILGAVVLLIIAIVGGVIYSQQDAWFEQSKVSWVGQQQLFKYQCCHWITPIAITTPTHGTLNFTVTVEQLLYPGLITVSHIPHAGDGVIVEYENGGRYVLTF